MSETAPPGDWMDSKELARLLEVPERTPQDWRNRRVGLGPPWYKIGGKVRYKRADVAAWIAANTHPQPAPGRVEAPT